MGAHRIVNSRSAEELQAIAGTMDFILSTVNVDLDWDTYVAALAPRGRLHTVGAVPSPIPVQAFALLGGQKSVSGSPLGSPATIAQMLRFCDASMGSRPSRCSRVSEALEHLESGRARYRIALEKRACE
jgi:uncharacterized zinc-type alcohol dehydrogenase-like protein